MLELASGSPVCSSPDRAYLRRESGHGRSNPERGDECDLCAARHVGQTWRQVIRQLEERRYAFGECHRQMVANDFSDGYLRRLRRAAD